MKHEHPKKESNSAVLDREPDHAPRNGHVEKKKEKVSDGIRQMAVDLLEQETHRPRTTIESEVASVMGQEVISAVVRSILTYIDQGGTVKARST